jgi:uncharacterized SAM-binding protein YcdF (DUF218 family)
MRLLISLLRLLSKTFLFALLLWASGLVWFVMQIPWHPSTDDKPADAIVALTGGAERLDYALALLASGKAQKLFISGVENNATLNALFPEPSQQALLHECAPGSIELGTIARDTKGNAQEAADWIDMHKFKTVRLVTANYHMPRSLFEFRGLMPDIQFIATPVFPPPFHSFAWLRDPSAISLVLSEYLKFIATHLHALLL